MLTKNQFKTYTSLKQVKYRYLHELFVVEGLKNVLELAHSAFVTEALITTENWLKVNAWPDALAEIQPEWVTEKEMAQLSSLSTPPGLLAIAQIPPQETVTINLNESFTLVLDGIHDPGNLGTILRSAEWFGFQPVVCSDDCVDVFNSKVVQASMGSVFHVPVAYRALTELFAQAKEENVPVCGAVLQGDSLYTMPVSASKGIIVIGSESHGIREEHLPFLDYSISIPNFSAGTHQAESLNASIATAVILSELRRRSI